MSRVASTVDAVGMGLVLRAGLNPIDAKSPEHVRQRQAVLAEQGHEYRDCSLIDALRAALQIRGHVGSNFTARNEIMRAAVSTGAMTAVFTQVAGAALLQAYDEAPDSTAGWVREADCDSFKDQERFRLGKSATPEPLPRGDTATHASLGDEKETYRVTRYAKQFVVDEQDIIDDNFDALITVPDELGRAARQLRPDLVYSTLLANANMRDGNPLFDATNHGNLGEAGSALTAAAVQTAISAIAKQTQGGRNLNLKPQFLIVPPDIVFGAMIVLNSAERIIAVDSGGTFNPLKDQGIAPRSDNRIGVAGAVDPLTGTAYAGTATNWFLACGGVNAAIEVGYLRGTGRRPVVRSFPLERGQYGVCFDVKLDIGVKALDWRPIYKATGEN